MSKWELPKEPQFYKWESPITEIFKRATGKRIELPDWARIGAKVLVKDVKLVRGDNPEDWYTEKIIAFGYDGVFHQAHNCPMYYTKFDEYGKTIKLKGE